MPDSIDLTTAPPAPGTDPTAGAPAEPPRPDRRPVAAIAGVFGYLILVSFGMFVLYLFTLPLKMGGMDAMSDDSAWVEVYEFTAVEPGRGDRRGLRAAAAREGLAARWHFGELCFRVAFDCHGDECFGSRSDDVSRLSRLFAAHGFALDGESQRLAPNHQAQLRGPWAFAVVAGAFSEMLLYLPLLLVGFVARRTLRKAYPEGTGPEGEPPPIGRWSAAGLGLAAGAGLAGLTLLATRGGGAGPLTVLHDASFSCGSVSSAGTLGLLLTALLTVAVAPLAEETFFRSWAVPYLEFRAGTVAVYVGSAGIWAFLHQADETAAPILLGLVLVWSYRRTRRLAAPLAIHAAFNAIVLIHWWQTRPPF